MVTIPVSTILPASSYKFANFLPLQAELFYGSVMYGKPLIYEARLHLLLQRGIFARHPFALRSKGMPDSPYVMVYGNNWPKMKSRRYM